MENELNLGELFNLADKIGDKYLNDDEIQSRKAEYEKIVKDIESIASDADRR